MLISGATLFALLQAPAVVDRWYMHAAPHLDGAPGFLAFFGFYYAKLILYTLISTFLLHLVARAYWVGLVGLHSVYPAGIRWRDVPYGPAFMERLREGLPAMALAIRRMDDVSSLLFSGGAVVLLLCVASLLAIAAVAFISMAVSRVLFGGEYLTGILLVLAAAVSLIPVVTRAVDLHWGRRNPGTTPPVWLRLASLLSYYLGATAVVGPLSLVLSSNLGRRSANIATMVVFTGIVGLFIVRDVLLQRGILRFDGHAHLADAVAAQETLPSHYADQREPGTAYPLAPFIQREMVGDAYVRLFVPLTTQGHNALVAERCPSVQRVGGGLRLVRARARGGEPPDASAFLACVASFQPVSLDGMLLDDLPWRLGTDAMSGVRGIIAHIPLRDVAPGEHILRVEALPWPKRQGRRPRPARAPHIVRFWN